MLYILYIYCMYMYLPVLIEQTETLRQVLSSLNFEINLCCTSKKVSVILGCEFNASFLTWQYVMEKYFKMFLSSNNC